MPRNAKVGDIVKILREFRYLLPNPRGLVHHINVNPKNNERVLEVRVPAKFWKSDVNLKNRNRGNIVIVNDEEITIL